MDLPSLVLLISGKRKCGKDYISEKLNTIVNGSNCCIVRISEPIKGHYATCNNLSLDELMSDGPFKEQHRQKMIEWSDGVRQTDPGYFCATACAKAPKKKVWIVSDIRRKTDIKWFLSTYGELIKTVRINAKEEVRKNRGWTFTKGVDNVASECDLDDYAKWDVIISNDDDASCNDGINKILQLVKPHIEQIYT